MQSQISFDQFKEQWLEDVKAGNPNTVQLGNRFSRKLVSQWLDFARIQKISSFVMVQVMVELT